MPTFQYSAYDRSGKQHSGSLNAETERQVRKQLKEQALFPNAVTKLATAKNKNDKPGFFSRFFNQVNNFELALILRQLGILIKSGLPLEDSLKLILEQADSTRQRVLVESWRSEIMEGRSFSSAMRRSKYVLPEAIIAGVGVGEETGHLHEVMMRMADELETGAENRQAFRRGLTYPITLIIACMVAVTVMMLWVVPKITRVFISAKAELPAVTQFVVAVSNFTQAYGLYIFLGTILAFIGFQIYLANADNRRLWHKQLARVPGLGNWIRMANLADWSRSLGTLLGSGVPALAALKISSSVMTNLYMQYQMEAVTERMRRGSSLHQSLRDESAGTGFLLHMVSSGEASSELDAMLMRVSEYYSSRLKSSVDTFLKLMNPIIIIIMGFVILIIVAAVMLPILKMNEMV